MVSFLLLFHFPSFLLSEDLNYSIKGKSLDSVELETLSPSPDIPSADSILFSLDGGKTAREKEVNPLSPYEAILKTDPSRIPPQVLPLTPIAPFIVQPLPLGDKVDIRRNQDVFGKGREEAVAHYDWEFRIVDETNKLIHKQEGRGRPPNPLTWDGFHEGQFAIDPNRTINSYLVIKSSDEIVGTWPGEAVRFLSVGYKEDKNFIIQFSKRIYNDFESTFSGGGKIFLRDLASRLYDHVRHAQVEGRDPESIWSITLYEPVSLVETDTAEGRKVSWQSFFEETLNEIIPFERIKLEETEGEESWVKVVLHNYKSPNLPNMRGRPAPPRPHFEDISNWVKVDENEEALLIDLRHDRLFLPGSAYLRDEALPDLSKALARVGEESKIPKPIVLRSYTEKVRDKKRNKFEEDTQLAALRSKVLFMLFAKERLLTK